MARGKKANGHDAAADAEVPESKPGQNRPSDKDAAKVARSIIRKDVDIDEARAALNSLVGERRGMVKSAKKAGHDMVAMLRVISERKQEVEEVARIDFNYRHYTMLLNAPLGHQFQMWGEEAGADRGLRDDEAQEQRTFDAEQQGYHAGKNGHVRDTNPFHQSEASELYTAFNNGWLKGQASIAKSMKPNVIKAPTEVRKRAGRAADKAPETALERDEAAFRGNGTDAQPAAE